MGKALGMREAGLRLYPMDRFEHLRFIEVEGEVQEATGARWSALLRGAVQEHAEGIAVDLRGCRGIDAHSLQQLLAAATTLKVRGGVGVVLVVVPGSALALRLRLLAGDELQMCDSTRTALTALGERSLARPPFARVEQEAGVAIIAVNGAFDHAGGGDFGAALDEALALEVPLVVDLEHCGFIDLTGIAILVRSFRLASDRGFALAASGPQEHRVSDLIGIPEQLPAFESRRDAIGALSS